MAATVLPSIKDRVVVRCEHCTLVQFCKDQESICKGCHRPLEYTPPPPPLLTHKEKESKKFSGCLPKILLHMRRERQLTQKTLSERMGGHTRPYVSRIERGIHVPTLWTLAQYARALDTRASSLAAFFEDPGAEISPRIDGLNKKMLLCVGPTVKRLRQEAHLSQGDLQRVLPGTSRSNISRWESGCPPPGLSYLERFADVIKLPLSAIIIQIEQSALPNE
jgi:transcriptional regulator with XRE-family HTH domain